MTLETAITDYSADVVLYYGAIHRDGYKKFCDVVESKAEKKDTLCIVLMTYGGDPDAAYCSGQVN